MLTRNLFWYMLYVNPKLNTGTKRYQLTVLQFGWLIFFYFILTIEQNCFMDTTNNQGTLPALSFFYPSGARSINFTHFYIQDASYCRTGKLILF